jgi:hypothetical protein
VIVAALALALAVGLPPHARGPAIAVTPARLALVGASSASVRLTSAVPEVVRAKALGLAVDLGGRPSVAAPADASAWLRVRPQRLTVRRGGATISVTARPPPRARPGDHVALLLITTRSPLSAGVAVRVRIGIVVTVRVPGRLVHRVVLARVRVRRIGRRRIVEVDIANRGNVTEQFVRGTVTVLLARRGRTFARLVSAARDLLPGHRGRAALVYRGAVRGPVRALVEIGSSRSGPPALRRLLRLRL